jgi:hypothetical protein
MSPEEIMWHKTRLYNLKLMRHSLCTCIHSSLVKTQHKSHSYRERTWGWPSSHILAGSLYWLSSQAKHTRNIKLKVVLHNMLCTVLVFNEHLNYTIGQKSPASEMKNYGPEKCGSTLDRGRIYLFKVMYKHAVGPSQPRIHLNTGCCFLSRLQDHPLPAWRVPYLYFS